MVRLSNRRCVERHRTGREAEVNDGDDAHGSGQRRPRSGQPPRRFAARSGDRHGCLAGHRYRRLHRRVDLPPTVAMAQLLLGHRRAGTHPLRRALPRRQHVGPAVGGVAVVARPGELDTAPRARHPQAASWPARAASIPTTALCSTLSCTSTWSTSMSARRPWTPITRSSRVVPTSLLRWSGSWLARRSWSRASSWHGRLLRSAALPHPASMGRHARVPSCSLVGRRSG